MSFSRTEKYQVLLAKSATKEYWRLPVRVQLQVKDRLVRLAADPIIGKRLKGELAGYYSLRVWPYRIIYRIDAQRAVVLIYRIAHRQGVYRS